MINFLTVPQRDQSVSEGAVGSALRAPSVAEQKEEAESGGLLKPKASVDSFAQVFDDFSEDAAEPSIDLDTKNVDASSLEPSDSALPSGENVQEAKALNAASEETTGDIEIRPDARREEADLNLASSNGTKLPGPDVLVKRQDTAKGDPIAETAVASKSVDGNEIHTNTALFAAADGFTSANAKASMTDTTGSSVELAQLKSVGGPSALSAAEPEQKTADMVNTRSAPSLERGDKSGGSREFFLDGQVQRTGGDAKQPITVTEESDRDTGGTNSNVNSGAASIGAPLEAGRSSSTQDLLVQRNTIATTAQFNVRSTPEQPVISNAKKSTAEVSQPPSSEQKAVMQSNIAAMSSPVSQSLTLQKVENARGSISRKPAEGLIEKAPTGSPLSTQSTPVGPQVQSNKSQASATFQTMQAASGSEPISPLFVEEEVQPVMRSGSVFAAGAAVPSSAANAWIFQSPDLPRHVLQQLSDAMRGATDRKTELLLNPVELGKVRISMTSVDAGLAVSISAERPETLELLRRHSDQLAQDLRSLGYDASSFDFGQGSAGSSSSGEASRGDHGPNRSDEQDTPINSPQHQMPMTRVVALDRVDLRL